MVETLTTFGLRWVESTWLILVDSAFLFLLGLLLAGIVSLWLNQSTIRRVVKGSSTRSVFMATLVGIPLPLCSCSVLPIATQLRRSGLGKGATTAFLIATPETGVDSIFLTYTLTDPILTVARPVSAFLTASIAGIAEYIVASPKSGSMATGAVHTDSCGCDDGQCKGLESSVDEPIQNSWFTRVWSTVKDLMSDLAPYLFLGFLLAGLVSSLISASPADIPDSLKTGWIGYAAAIVIGLPLYVCATSSTPLAAVLLGAGFSPGAVLTFLLTGPATNIATILVVKRLLGWASTVRYVVIITITAVLSGIVLDWVYTVANIQAVYHPGEEGEQFGWVSQLSAIILICAVSYYCYRWLVRKYSSFSLKRSPAMR